MHFYRGSGTGAARYFDEGHQGAESYYTEASRSGAARVAVEIDTWAAGERSGPTVQAGPGDLIRWVEGIDLATGEMKGLIRSGGKDRQPLRFVEVVVNNPKSLSIVASQNPTVAAAVDRVLTRQADEISAYLSSVAVTRTGPRGGQVEVGGLSVETARVRHLTSREGDPHRHVHLMVNTRVRTADGEWRGLHSAAVRQHIRAVNERGTRILLTDRDLREVLASEGYSLGADGEIDQARAAVELLSKRAAQIAGNRAQAEAAWRGEHPGREPSQRVVNGWDQAGWAEGRKAKPYVRETPEEMSERVRVELAEVGLDFTPGARTRLVEQDQAMVSVGQVDRDGMAGEAVAVLSSMRSAWSEAELTAGVEARVSASGLVGDPGAVAELVEDVRARAAGRCVSVLDPDVHAPTAMSRHLTSAQVLDADVALNLGLAGLAGETRGRNVEMGIPAGLVGLDAGQAAAAAAVCGPRRLEVVVGPAGTGKTRMLAVAKTGLDGQGRALRVVAPTRKGAQVAAAEIGVEGAALSKLLYEHGWRWDSLGRWARLEPGQDDPATGRTYEGPDEGWALTAASVVIVDEAGLMTVDQANALIDLAAETGAAVRLVGDPRQLGAVGRGGVMETASRWVDGGPVVLDQVHRFLTITPGADGLPVVGPDVDYAGLSLLLRDGAQPEVAAARLAGRGALVVHASQADTVAAIAAQVAAAQDREEADGLAVTVATNDQADQVNQAVRALRVAAGQVDDTRSVAGMGGVAVGVGDRIVTRRNNTAADVANRECWRVEKVIDDGTIAARSLGSGPARRVRLDAAYVAGAVQLAYASTDYGNQGITCDRSVTWVTEATSAGGLYVGATRGRYDNTLHLVAADMAAAQMQLIAAVGRHRADRGLDAARTLARTDAFVLPASDDVEPSRSAERLIGRVPGRVDPGGWRTEAELRMAAETVEARLAEALDALVDVEVMAEPVRERADMADRAAVIAARQQADRGLAEAARIRADRYRLGEQTTAEFVAARDDAQTIAAGPGRLGRKASQVDMAVARRAEIAARWPEVDLPGPAWTDLEVHAAALAAVETAVTATAGAWQAEAARHTGIAETLSSRIAARRHDQRTAITTNRANAHGRQALLAGADQARARLAAEREARTVQAAAMTPGQVGEADLARSAYLAEQARLHQTLPARTPDVDLAGRAGRAGLDPATFDPAQWRTVGDLAGDAETVEAALAAGLRLLPSAVPVMADDEWDREDQADRAAATEARGRAARARDEAARVEAGRDDLIDKATAEFLAGRDAARVVEAGPGRFARRTALVEDARARWAEAARAWSPHPFPGPAWDDQTVYQAAITAATETVIAAARPYHDAAGREERTAAGHEHRIDVRGHDQHQARETNEGIAGQHRMLLETAEAGRDTIAAHWEVRAGRVETLTPQQLAAADHARELYTAEQTRRRELTAQRQQALRARELEQQRSLEIDHGYGIEM